MTTTPRASDRWRLLAWAVGVTLVALIRNRIWATPNLAFFTTISTSLGTNPFSTGFSGDYLMTNLTGPVLARWTGQIEPHTYVRLHLGAFVVGLGTVVAGARARFGDRVARVLIAVVAVAPATTVTLQWLGQPDAFTVPLGMWLAICRRRITLVVVAMLVGLTHSEQGLVIALTAAIARLAIEVVNHPDRPRAQSARSAAADAGFMVGGVTAGRAVTEVYFAIADIVVTTPRSSFLELGMAGFWDHHRQAGLWLLLALWGPLWLAGAWLAARRRGLASALVGMGAALGVAPVLITLDQTRVYAMVTVPLLVAVAVIIGSPHPTAPPRHAVPRHPMPPIAIRLATIGTAMAAMIVPGFFTAGDVYFATNLPAREFVTFVRTGEHPGDLTGWLLGPFGFEVSEPE